MTSSADTSPARRLRDALEPVATLSFYSKPSLDAYEALGLSEFGLRYFWQRSSPMGEVDAAAVTAAFGVWEPKLVARNLATARERCSLSDIRTATQRGAAAAVDVALGPVGDDELRHVTTVLRRGVDAADATARPLFAGNRAWAWPTDDVHLTVWRVATAWRELRGDAHLNACVAAGITGIGANVLTELEVGYPLGQYTSTREWSEAQIEAAVDELRERGLVDGEQLSDDGRKLRADIETWTDAAVQPAIDAVGDELDRVIERIGVWAQLVIDRGWFPGDAKKRAAG